MSDWRSMHDRIGLDHLRGKHSGVPAVVLGSGPSLRLLRNRIFTDRVTITVNSSIMLFPNSDYYLSSDGNTTRAKHWESVESGSSHIILQHPALTGVQRRLGADRVSLFSKDPGVWALNPFADHLIFGFGSTHCAAHLAAIMGCTTIYLIGCDCRFVGKNRHYWQFPEFQHDFIRYPSKTEEALLKESWTKPYGEVYPGDDGTTDNHLWESFNGWKAIRKSSPEIDIRDASGGILSGVVFPAATVDEAIGVAK